MKVGFESLERSIKNSSESNQCLDLFDFHFGIAVSNLARPIHKKYSNQLSTKRGRGKGSQKRSLSFSCLSRFAPLDDDEQA